MKYFVVEGTFTKPVDMRQPENQEILKQHHAFSKKGLDAGRFLFFGPKVGVGGGFFIAKAEEQSVIEDMMKEDPFVTNGFAQYSVKEFRMFNGEESVKQWFD